MKSRLIARSLLAAALIAALGAAAFGARTAAPSSDRLPGFASIEVIDDFLTDSRRYLGL